MRDFIYSSPTKVYFGRDAEQRTGSVLESLGARRVLLHSGGGSAERSGLLDRIRASLKAQGIAFVELPGVKPNPVLSKVREGVALCLREQVDFILAVGGGSVIDSAKAVALGAGNPGDDVWDYYLRRREPRKALPLASVLTIAAAGSETGSGSVLTNEDGGLKRGYGSELIRPAAAFLNPALLATLTKRQIAAGVTDILLHTFERYFVPESGGAITDVFAEGLMRTVLEAGPRLADRPGDYEAASEILWAGSLSHNGLTGLGAAEDWATHQLGHELSGMFDSVHGETLAAMWGAWARYVYGVNPSRFARFARHVWGLADAADDGELARVAIGRTEQFFKDLGMPVTIPALLGRKLTPEELRQLAQKCTFFGQRTIGSFRVLNQDDILAVYSTANGEGC